MRNSPIEVITFDLDDTLWAVEPVLQKAEQRVYRWLQQHAPALTGQFSPAALAAARVQYYQQRPDLAHQISKLRLAALQHLLQQAGLPRQESLQLAQQAFAIFIAARQEVQVFDSAIPMLKALHPHYRLGVLTNGNADVYQQGIGEFFEFAFSAEQLNASKPAADHFIAARQHCGCQAGQIIHVGDHLEHDVLAAQQAGCHSIWFNPHNRPSRAGLAAGEQVRCLSEIPEAISRIEKKRG